MHFFSMKQWLLNIVVAVIITAVLSIILPEGKMGKFIKSFFAFFIMLIILMPVINIDFSAIDYEMIFSSNNISVQTDYIEYSSDKKISFYEGQCAEIAENCGITGAKVDINYEITTNGNLQIKNVIFNLKNAEFISDKAHIDIIEESKNTVAKYLNIGNDLVVFYE